MFNLQFMFNIYASSRAATPGRTFPSNNSREAPPPVEIWLISPARPDCIVAATESPPPMIVMQPLSLVISAKILIKSKVPFANFSISKTPIGPFIITVLAVDRLSFCSFVVSGPLSSPIHPSGMLSADTTFELASAEKASATIMSEGRRMIFPSFSALANTSLAVPTKSSSTREVPTSRPLAFKKVKTIPPPMITVSHLSKRASKTVILVETLDPPTMATIGFSPFDTAPSRYSSSLAKRNPDTDGLKNLVTPSVLAWARCAVPNASLTNKSNGLASFSTNPGSFLVSSL
mmetsp:Transcript_56191/g.62834  ORF Transcript_56191/g.62834 Transcript_56191/m.62834 type:complete len:290 (-) Transcript_56191:549-1418(-)